MDKSHRIIMFNLESPKERYGIETNTTTSTREMVYRCKKKNNINYKLNWELKENLSVPSLHDFAYESMQKQITDDCNAKGTAVNYLFQLRSLILI